MILVLKQIDLLWIFDIRDATYPSINFSCDSSLNLFSFSAFSNLGCSGWKWYSCLICPCARCKR